MRGLTEVLRLRHKECWDRSEDPSLQRTCHLRDAVRAIDMHAIDAVRRVRSVDGGWRHESDKRRGRGELEDVCAWIPVFEGLLWWLGPLRSAGPEAFGVS